MLRPAYLLPDANAGLLTLRFGRADLSPRRESATRRVTTYRDGTLTRWISAA